MASVNKVILIGNLGADPEVRYMDNKQCVANIRIATNRSYTNKNNEKVDETEWHSVSLWGKLGETTEKYLKKGNPVYIEGRLRTRKWTDQNGVERYTTEVIAENMVMLGNKQSGGFEHEPVSTNVSNSTSNNNDETNSDNSQEGSDDLPF